MHRREICHRDLKPDNCFVGSKGQVWVGDLGTARRLLGDPLEADYGRLMFRGDRRYTAPELFCGLESEELYKLGDFYSLGAILFEMFTHVGLYHFVFTPALVKDLGDHFYFVTAENRQEVFEGLLPDLLADKILPNMGDYENVAPRSILTRLERLFQGLSHLDFRKRLNSFPIVFNEIERCRIILRKEREYERWRLQRGNRGALPLGVLRR